MARPPMLAQEEYEGSTRPVSSGYEGEFPFTGNLERVDFDLG